MKKLSAAALLLVGALALAGCTTGANSAPEAATASPVAAQQVADAKPEADPRGVEPERQEWADGLVDSWAKTNGVPSVQDFRWPHNLVTGWGSTGDDQLTLIVDDRIANGPSGNGLRSSDPVMDLDSIAALMALNVCAEAPNLTVTAVTEDGKVKASDSC